ncbi:MAG: histidinol dehydrogenase [Bacteroidota bacterium]|nr:histidinol dehydrogenase [Bacteroidota bacterium]
MNSAILNPLKKDWSSILQRPAVDLAHLRELVSVVLGDIKKNGDEAAKKYSYQFDKIIIDDFKVSEQEFVDVDDKVEEELKLAISVAKNNIETFHALQKNKELIVQTMPGVLCKRKAVPIESVGLYIPGGTAPLFSTLLMLGIPAVLAGCKNIIVCTPPDKSGNINPVILYVANLLGLRNVFKIGGVQAIGAMAYGTETIPKVHKIFGPGNQYVTCAKQLINMEGIAIDMPAGPSEVAIYADASCIPAFVAADLLSQAEHGADSQVLLVADSLQIIKEVQAEINLQIKKLSRQNIIENVLANSRFIVMENKEDAFDLLNEYAPEHLIIASKNAEELSKNIKNAGSVFLGNYSPESVGDYASGTNHTLPTNGAAKAFSGVSLESFMKHITFQNLSKEGIKNLAGTVEVMAAAEGLDAHANAVKIRLNKINKDEI